MSELLILKAKHFKNAEFGSPANCAIARAAKEQFGAVEVNPNSTYIYVHNKTFYHIEYGFPEFNEDKIKAELVHFSGDVIRKVSLIKV